MLARDGVHVSASDISPLAVENTKVNAKKNNIKLERVLLSDVYDGFRAQYTFDAIYWNAPWMETIEHDKIDDLLGYGLFDNGYSCLERFIKQTNLYLKPNGKLYLGHADFGDYKRLESLFDKYGYEHQVIADEKSVEIRDVEFYLYEAQLKEKQNQVFISMPYTKSSNIDINNKKAEYGKIAEKYGLRIVEESFGMENKYNNFEDLINLVIAGIEKAQVLLIESGQDSDLIGYGLAYADRERCIPYMFFQPDSIDSINQAFEFSNRYCLQG